MKSNFKLMILLCCIALITGCVPLQPQKAGTVSTEASNGDLVQGRVVDIRGNPVENVTIRIIPQDYPGDERITSTDENGIYHFNTAGITGMIKIRIGRDNCGTVVRTDIDLKKLTDHRLRDLPMMCSEPMPPMKKHRSHPGISYRQYLGSYRMIEKHKREKCECGTVEFTDLKKSDDSKCKCSSDRWIVIFTSKQGYKGYGCWQVEKNGDVEVYFTCYLTFGGNKYVFWKKGRKIIGRRTSWSDAGTRSWSDIILMPERK